MGGIIKLELQLFHVQLHFFIVEESDIDPFVSTSGDLFVMDDIVPGWTITFLVKLEFITSQT